MNIESVRDLKRLPHGIDHKIRIFGLIESIEYDNTSYTITVTKTQLREPLFRIKLRSEEKEYYLLTLVKWMVYNIGSQIDVKKPFQLKNITSSNHTFVDCECKYRSSPNNRSVIMLTDMTPMDYDAGNEIMRKIMSDEINTPSLPVEKNPFLNTDYSSYQTKSSPRSFNDFPPTQPPIDTQTVETQDSQFDLLNHLRKRKDTDSQLAYESQPMELPPPPVKRTRVKREQEIIEEEMFQTPLQTPPETLLPSPCEPLVENDTNTHDLTSSGYLTKMSELSQFDQCDIGFQYVGYITDIVKIESNLWRYNTIMMSDFHDLNSVQGTIEVYGKNKLKIGLYEFKCKTWIRQTYINIIAYLLVDFHKINLHEDEDEDDNNNNNNNKDGFKRSYNDKLLQFDQIDLSQGKDQFIRLVGVCVAISNEHAHKSNGYHEIMLTDFTINPRERCKYFFDRYIDSWEVLQLKHEQGIRIKLFNNYFTSFDQQIKKRYNGKSMYDMVNNHDQNISRQRILVEFTIRIVRYGRYLDAISKGHKILTSLPEYTWGPGDLFSNMTAARGAKILAICSEIKNNHEQKGQHALMSRRVPDRELDNLPTTEQFKINRVFDMLLTYGGESTIGPTQPQVEVLCQGEYESVSTGKRHPLVRLIVKDPDLFFCGSSDLDRRLQLTDSMTKVQTREGGRIESELQRALPQLLHAPVASQESTDLVLQQLFDK